MSLWSLQLDRPAQLAHQSGTFELHAILFRDGDYYQFLWFRWSFEDAGFMALTRSGEAILIAMAIRAARTWQRSPHEQKDPPTDAVELRPGVDQEIDPAFERSNKEGNLLAEWSDWSAGNLRLHVMAELKRADELGDEDTSQVFDRVVREARMTKREYQSLVAWLADNEFVMAIGPKYQANGDAYLFEVTDLTEAGRDWAERDRDAVGSNETGHLATASADRHLMEAAIEEMKFCSTTPKVGVVIVDGSGMIIASAHKTVTTDAGTSEHAERVALHQIDDDTQRPITLYTTLEPCTETSSDCASEIVDAGVEIVVIGNYDINSAVYLKGKAVLNRAGIKTRDFDSDLRARCTDINSDSVRNFQQKVGPNNHGKYGYTANGAGGVLTVRFSPTDSRSIGIAFTQRGRDSVYAVGRNGVTVALAAEASSFDHIDDPSAYAGFSHTVEVSEGQIAIFKSEAGAVLLRIDKVFDTERAVKYQFEVRPEELHP